MLILGLDPGTTTTGFGIIKKEKSEIKVIDYGILPSTKSSNHNINLQQLHKGLKTIINKYKPSITAVERLFFFKNKKTALQVAEARGVILLTIQQYGLPIIEPTPLQVKQGIAGYGQATKDQVQFMLIKLTDLKEKPKPDDAADAIALAIYAATSFKSLLLS